MLHVKNRYRMHRQIFQKREYQQTGRTGKTLTDIKMNNIKDPKRLFDPTLFWDAESVDIEQHADYIIARVLDFGDEKDLKTLREIYADEKLIRVVKGRRGLLSMTRRFWSVYFNITLPELKNDRGRASTESP